MSDLLDASVWVALTHADHVHHPRARRYWENEALGPVAFCRITALALLRHLTNRHIMHAGVLTGDAAWRTYRRWRALPSVVFLPDPADVETHLEHISRLVELTPRLWTDAYLAAFTLAGGLRFVTFDHDFTRFDGLDLLLLEA
ncbi:MAG: TA system VapC family ribonuclease toxin [Dehalococcoidia bacterium]